MDDKRIKVYLDCGYHIGEGMNNFTTELGLDNTWEVYAFEANPECKLIERIKKHPFKVIPIEKAVWTHDGVVGFRREDITKSDSHSPSDDMSPSKFDGWGSNVEDLKSTHRGLLPPITIPCICFSKFVSDLFKKETHKVICKMDIEGAEYPVLRQMIKENTIGIIDTFYMDWHESCIPGETEQTRNTLIAEMSKYTTHSYWK